MFSNHQTNSRFQQKEIKQKLSALLTIVISFQNKIENVKEKLCGYPEFSPELYYSELDQNKKGHIDMRDLAIFLKSYKESFKVQPQYMQELIKNLNIGQIKDGEKLSYFGYLNMIKPYFNKQLARDLLLRDSITHGKGIKILNKNETILRLLNQLISLTYVCIAEHEQIKQLIASEYFLNIREISTMIFQNDQQSSYNNISVLSKFCTFINENSEYEVNRDQMKFLLSFMHTHEYLLNTEKEMTKLFMPGSEGGKIIQIQQSRIPTQQEIHHEKTANRINENANFLNYVHPNSLKIIPPSAPQNNFENHSQKPIITHRNPVKQIESEQSIPTPVLQRFLRESKVLKNMSKEPRFSDYQSQYRSNYININNDYEANNESAFIQESLRPAPRPEPVFNIEQILYTNKQVNRSQYMNISKYDKKPRMAPIMQADQSNNKSLLGNFLLK